MHTSANLALARQSTALVQLVLIAMMLVVVSSALDRVQ
jgi:hypothetical protein